MRNQNIRDCLADRKIVLLVSLLFITLFSACSPSYEYEKFEGVTYIAPVGHPPADTLVWSPVDPNKLLVTGAEVGFQNVEVYILDIETGQKTVLMESNMGIIGGDTWSPDGRYIILSVSPDTRGFEGGGLWIWDTENKQLDLFYEGNFHYADFSPNGERLVVYTVKRKTEDSPRMVTLNLIDIDSKEVELLFKSDEYFSIPGLSWSPDGRQIVYSLETSYDHNLYLIDPDYSDKSNLYLLDVETHHTIQLTTEDDNLFPDWAPSGNLIAYHKYWNRAEEHGDNFFLINPTNGCEIEIPYNMRFILGPTWTRDGKKIAFVGPDGIYTLDLMVAFGEDFLSNDFPCE